MSTDENKAVVRRAYDLLNTGGASAFDELIAPGMVMHPRGRADVMGIEAYRSYYAALRSALPDQRWTLEDQVAEGDLVATVWTFRGTHRGELMGIAPTGKEVTVTGMSLFRLADGKIAENWVQSDLLGLLQQLGAIPTPSQAGR